ncbi:zinc ABC transporter substrate-binding protein [Gracilibacillus caseinilyticus]|uniref:Zinc ABC transporter substrate-binding protein n=1 Tax=Gracilibacillus caseinilyticus TaxID=2932256 RepID=A0ABY4EYI8_9BACI|nr:zinc ABC transporter substrate-binding protein [Gracilibacillus caseinilyticus]UOQ49339.1 zinc ABC transporter substrate-binding protein [Gracilibacillus caseinilyticus]
MRIYGSITILLSLIALLFLAACATDQTLEDNNEAIESTNASEESTDELQLFTTLYPLAYFAEQIGGEHVNVESILPLGADAHTYEPTSKTMVDIAAADAFIYSGPNMETYGESIEEAIQGEDVKVLKAANNITLLEHSHDHSEEAHEHGEEDHTHSEETDGEEGHEHSHSHGDKDPHVWLDPIRSIDLAENIKNMLVELKPSAEDEFEANFSDLQTRLKDLDENFHEQLENAARSEILVTHAAYGYWEEAYGIEQIAISGLSPSNEPSQKKLEEVIEIVGDHDIHYLLFEQNVEPKIANIIQKETNVDSLNIHNLSVITEEDVVNNEDYFTLMQRNLDTLLTALAE